MLMIFSPGGQCLEKHPMTGRYLPDLADFRRNHGGDCIFHEVETDPYPTIMAADLVADIAARQVVVGSVRPREGYQPSAPATDPLAELAKVVARNVAASPHDRRFLTQKAIGKQAIAWTKEHPDCTPQEAEEHVMALVLAELPGEPMVPKLYWEHQGAPQGLAMSYLHEAIRRSYLPAGTPLAWASLVGLIVATPEEQISTWLRSL